VANFNGIDVPIDAIEGADYNPPLGFSVDALSSVDTTTATYTLVGFSPLQGQVISKSATTLVLSVEQSPGVLDTTDLRIDVDGLQIFDGTNWIAAYSGSSITGPVGGVFTINIVKTGNWIAGSRVIVIIYLPID